MFLPIKFVKLCFPSHQKSAYIPPPPTCSNGWESCPHPHQNLQKENPVIKKKEERRKRKKERERGKKENKN